MVLLSTTPLILSTLSSLPPSALPPDAPLPTSLSTPISHTTLIRLAALSSTSLHLLLRGTHPYFPPPPTPPQPSASYLALKARLLAQEEQRAYAAMVNKSQGVDEAAEQAEDEDNIPVSLPFNILVSILCCSGAIFYLTRWWSNAGLRVLLSLGVGVLVGVAEVVVYSGYLRKVKEAKGRERGRREVKEVVLEREEEKVVRDAMVGQEGEKEEIWGKGVNGGMRRRVREKWEKEQGIARAGEMQKSR